MITPEQTQQTLDWLNTSITIRRPKSKQKFCDSIGISVPTLNKIDTERGKKSKVDFGAEYNPDTFLENKSETIDRALVQACEKGNATALQTYYKLTKRLIEQSKTEVTIGFDATTIARIRNEARRELSDEGFTTEGSGKVRPQPALLSENIRQS
ncbi:MAG: hypothetical protein MUP81_01360 [Dehalococcoidia bacterium]|nr:hypothetical protein [Dehalococcoidia bacterium]